MALDNIFQIILKLKSMLYSAIVKIMLYQNWVQKKNALFPFAEAKIYWFERCREFQIILLFYLCYVAEHIPGFFRSFSDEDYHR